MEKNHKKQIPDGIQDISPVNNSPCGRGARLLDIIQTEAPANIVSVKFIKVVLDPRPIAGLCRAGAPLQAVRVNIDVEWL